MQDRLRAGVLGGTGMVGQRLVTLLAAHPWFALASIAASPTSAGRTYEDAVGHRWKMGSPVPDGARALPVRAVEADFDRIVNEVDLVFCALDMDRDRTRAIECRYANAGIPVISCNSAHRTSDDVPMLIPEVNADHVALLDVQRRNRGWSRGAIVVKPNCSIQSYVPILSALRAYRPLRVHVTTLQAISGAGKNFGSWPAMVDNVIPFIAGEEEKSEREPLKIWGTVAREGIRRATEPEIVATCIRVPVTDGHMASVSVAFEQKPTREQILEAIRSYPNPIAALDLPSAPDPFIEFLDDESRPQTALDRDARCGMGITMGRLREDSQFHWRFIGLSHNTIRGAAGGAILIAELLHARGYL